MANYGRALQHLTTFFRATEGLHTENKLQKHFPNWSTFSWNSVNTTIRYALTRTSRTFRRFGYTLVASVAGEIPEAAFAAHGRGFIAAGHCSPCGESHRGK